MPDSPTTATDSSQDKSSQPKAAQDKTSQQTTPQDKASSAVAKTPAATSGDSSQGQPGSALTTTEGRTTISDLVVSKIAGIATREVVGVHDLGAGASRAVGALRERIPGAKTNQSQGVSVEVGERQTAVDIDLVADYGVALADLAADIRRNVISAVEKMTGLEVTEVNVTVHDVFLDDGSEESSEPDAPRVQ